jgi:Cytochrome c7 and related cytochrome c
MRINLGSSRCMRRLAICVPLAAMVFTCVYLFLSPAAPAESQPPVLFDHEAMVQKGVPCLFCHSGALKSPAAGIPSVERCMGCHNVIKTDSPEIQEVAAYWVRQEPIPWPRVYQLPRFVYFSHRVHVAAGLNCERCHGDVGHMKVVRPVAKINMGWCLSCHNEQVNSGQLRDCVVCHQ